MWTHRVLSPEALPLPFLTQVIPLDKVVDVRKKKTAGFPNRLV